MARDDDRMVLFRSVPSEQEAMLLVGRLNTEGVEAFTEGGSISGFRAEAPGMVRVMVRAGDVERAAALFTPSAPGETQAASGRVVGPWKIIVWVAIGLLLALIAFAVVL